MGNDREYYNKKGEQDAAEGRKYDPPHPPLHELIMAVLSCGFIKNSEEEKKENEAYEAGYDKGKK